MLRIALAGVTCLACFFRSGFLDHAIISMRRAGFGSCAATPALRRAFVFEMAIRLVWLISDGLRRLFDAITARNDRLALKKAQHKLMPKGPQGQYRPVDIIGAAVIVGRIVASRLRTRSARHPNRSQP